MAGLRASPPTFLGGHEVRQIRDLQTGEATTLSTGARRPIDLPTSNVLAWDLVGGHRVLARPSGTEPKLKFYFEARAAMAPGEALPEAIARAEAIIDTLQADVLARAGVS